MLPSSNYVQASLCVLCLTCVCLQLTFTYFSLEAHSQCSWDSLTIFNGASPGSPVIGQYCGTNSPGTVQSGSSKMAVVFLGDHSVSKGGFVASWTADSSGGQQLHRFSDSHLYDVDTHEWQHCNETVIDHNIYFCYVNYLTWISDSYEYLPLSPGVCV